MWFIFITSLLVLNHLVFKPTLKILNERHKRTVGFEKDAKYYSEQSAIKLKEYESLMADARNLAREARENILKSATGHQREIISEARNIAENELALIKKQISEETRIAREKLSQESESLATEIASQLIQRKVA